MNLDEITCPKRLERLVRLQDNQQINLAFTTRDYYLELRLTDFSREYESQFLTD